jgi:hypothetical protein
MEKVFDSFFQQGNMYNQRTVCAFVTAFAGLLHVSRLINIRIRDSCIHSKEQKPTFIEMEIVLLSLDEQTRTIQCGIWSCSFLGAIFSLLKIQLALFFVILKKN